MLAQEFESLLTRDFLSKLLSKILAETNFFILAQEFVKFLTLYSLGNIAFTHVQRIIMQCRSVTMLPTRKRQPAALVILALQEEKQKKKRRWWIRPWIIIQAH